MVIIVLVLVICVVLSWWAPRTQNTTSDGAASGAWVSPGCLGDDTNNPPEQETGSEPHSPDTEQAGTPETQPAECPTG